MALLAISAVIVVGSVEVSDEVAVAPVAMSILAPLIVPAIEIAAVELIGPIRKTLEGLACKVTSPPLIVPVLPTVMPELTAKGPDVVVLEGLAVRVMAPALLVAPGALITLVRSCPFTVIVFAVS